MSFPGTGAWNAWSTRTMTATLATGTNTVRLTATISSGGPNLDYLDVEGPSGPTPTDYQAENATISQGAVESNHEGYTGSGFVNLDNVAGSYVQFSVTGTGNQPGRPLRQRRHHGPSDEPLDQRRREPARCRSRQPGAWTTWATVSRAISLTAGANTIRLTSAVSSGGPNLDRITLG